MTVVKDVPKSILKLRIENVILKTRLIFQKIKINYVSWLLNSMNGNLSLKDAEYQKSLLYGPEYLNSTEYAFAKLKIALNDLRISFHQAIIKKITREK